MREGYGSCLPTHAFVEPLESVRGNPVAEARREARMVPRVLLAHDPEAMPRRRKAHRRIEPQTMEERRLSVLRALKAGGLMRAGEIAPRVGLLPSQVGAICAQLRLDGLAEDVGSWPTVWQITESGRKAC